MTQILLVIGAATAAVFIAVLLVEGVFRPGYDSVYHTGSALSLGERGWVQTTNFLQFGAGMLAFAAGIHRALNTVAGAALVAVFGVGLIAAGVFRMDPMRGYPPGTPAGTPSELSWQHKAHDIAGPVMFLALFGACMALAGRLDGPMRLYTLFTAATGLTLTVSTAIAWQKDARITGLVQRALILVYCSWIALLALHLV